MNREEIYMKEKEKKYGLLKGVLLFIVIAVILTWLIPTGSFSSSGFTESVMTRVGINDLTWLIFYGIYFSTDKVILLLAIGGLYGVLVKTNAYDRLVTGIAQKIKHEKVAVVIFSILIAALTSILTQSFVVVIFIPFIISIMNRMKLDKMTIMATAFGSMLVGIMGATYGTDGLVYFSKYMATESTNISSSVLVRAGILVIGLVLFNFFVLTRMSKVKKNEETAELFAVEELTDTKKRSVIPIIILGIILFVIAILGYVDWNTNFGIEAFNNFHKTITEITIGDDFYIFKDLLGSQMGAFGTWDTFSMTAIVIIFTIIFGLCYRVSLNDFLKNYADGMKKMIKPSLCVVGAFTLMVVVYMSPIVATIVNKLLALTDGFNLATMTLSAFITNIFHTDLGYTAYILSGYLTAEYGDYANALWVIFTSLYGFVQFFIPTSVVMGLGLTSLDIKYKDWLKYIWRFLVGIIICLLIIFILIAIL